jgi:hypothetical protein
MAQYRKLLIQRFPSRSEGRSLDDESKPSMRDVFPVGANISSAFVNTMSSYKSVVTVNPATPSAALGDKVRRAADPGVYSLPASTSKARKVMHWFRSRIKGRSLDDESKPSVRVVLPVGANISSASVNTMSSYNSDVEYTSVPSRVDPLHPQRTAGTGTEGGLAALSLSCGKSRRRRGLSALTTARSVT